MKHLIIDDDKPVLVRKRSEEERADYHHGFETGLGGGDFDDSRSLAWKTGWTEAQE